MIIEEVANLLRSSASGAGVGAEAMRRMASASSSLVSDPERMPSIGADAASQAALFAGAVSAEKPSLWGGMAHAPSAPMPLRGGEASRLPRHWHPFGLPCTAPISISCARAQAVQGMGC